MCGISSSWSSECLRLRVLGRRCLGWSVTWRHLFLASWKAEAALGEDSEMAVPFSCCLRHWPHATGWQGSLMTCAGQMGPISLFAAGTQQQVTERPSSKTRCRQLFRCVLVIVRLAR